MSGQLAETGGIAAEAAWLAYRDQYQREHPWCDSRRVARQMRKRDFVAGYLAALAVATPTGAEGGGDRG